jgi:type I restriction enzyme S subunit
MNATQLLTHFNRICEAPDAIHRLRGLILDLAVRGKLTEQDAKDEPATTLLVRIHAEKVQLNHNGDSRKQKPRHSLREEGVPFSIPANWCWSQLAEVGLVSPRNTAADHEPASFVPMPLISAEYGIGNKHELRQWGDIRRGYTHFAEGDVGLAKITPCFENAKSTVFRGLAGGIGAGTTELHVVRPILISADYILVFLKSPHFIATGIPKMTGTAGQKRVPANYFAYSPFPLPPVAEQHRIVTRVNELMTLCDQLEAAQAEREMRRDRLTAASLNRLNHPKSADTTTFREHARFHLRHLPLMTARPDEIPQLRQTILNLAMRGKVVPQNPKEEPFGHSLEQIEAERHRYNFSDIGFDRTAFEESIAGFVPPPGWSIHALAQVALTIVDCPHSTPKWRPSGKVCVRTNQFRPGRLDLTEVRFVSEATFLERIQRLKPLAGDILYSREGGILGIACQVPPGLELCLGQRMMLVRPPRIISSAFLEMVLNSPLITDIARGKTTGGAAPRINVSTVKAYPIPLPPLAEQHRIVAKVEELLTVCGKLETQLTTAQNESHQLLESVLHEALSVS